MNEEASQHRPLPQTMVDALVELEFWYRNFQDRQREFLPIGFLFVAGNYLREQGPTSASAR